MNIAFAYLKCLDDWQDDRRLTALAEAKTLKAGYDLVCEKYPRQCAAIGDGLADLAAIEKEGREDPDAAAACFGAMLGELFVFREDRWSEDLRRMGDALGRALYVMDACMDLGLDAARGHYNPFRRYYGLSDNASRFRSALRMLMGDCLRAFDRLPLVQDLPLLKNILCLGLWLQFDRRYGAEEGTTG
jgi:hypothetical protein